MSLAGGRGRCNPARIVMVAPALSQSASSRFHRTWYGRSLEFWGPAAGASALVFAVPTWITSSRVFLARSASSAFYVLLPTLHWPVTCCRAAVRRCLQPDSPASKINPEF